MTSQDSIDINSTSQSQLQSQSQSQSVFIKLLFIFNRFCLNLLLFIILIKNFIFWLLSILKVEEIWYFYIIIYCF